MADFTKLNGYDVKDAVARQQLAQRSILGGDTTNPIYYGADPTGVEDSTSAINECIQTNKGGRVDFTPGIYKVTGSINLPFENDEKVSINGNGSKIIAYGTIESLFVGGYDRESEDDQNDVGFTSYIKDLIIDCSNASVTYGFKNLTGFKDWHLLNIRLYRALNGVLIGDIQRRSADIMLRNCMLYGKGSEYDGVGVISRSSDNNVIGCRIYGFRKGFQIKGYITIDDTQVLLRWENQTSTNFDPYPVNSAEFKTYYEQTNFASVEGPCRIVSSYADSVHKFLDISDTSESITLTKSFYYNARDYLNIAVVDVASKSPKLTITDCQFALRNGATTDPSVTLLRCLHENGVFDRFSQITISGIQVTRIDKLTGYGDIMLSGYPNKIMSNLSPTVDTWYVAGIIANWGINKSVNLKLDASGWNYNIRIHENNDGVLSFQQIGASETATRWTVGVVEIDSNLLVCIKSNEVATGVRFGIEVETSYDLVYSVPPINNGSVATSSRLLTDYTNQTPIKELAIKQALGIVSAVTPE